MQRLREGSNLVQKTNVKDSKPSPDKIPEYCHFNAL